MIKSVRSAALAVAVAAALVGCSSSKPVEKLNVYNWSDYIDESVITDFEKETGIDVRCLRLERGARDQVAGGQHGL
jgi:putrescine transport system substrate-binding protein